MVSQNLWFMPWLSENKFYIWLVLVLIAALLSFGFLPKVRAELALIAGNYYFNSYGQGVYDRAKAKKYFEKALKFDPNVPDAWHQLAGIDFIEGNFYVALNKINKQIEIHNDSFMASFYVRGLIQGYIGNFSQAEQDFKKFLEWDQRNWAAWNDLAWIYFMQGDYKKAQVASLKGLNVDPKNPWLLNSLGVSLLNQNKKAEARELFLEAKTYAEKLSEKDWQRAYPGNNPKSSKQGLEKIKKIIASNLELTN